MELDAAISEDGLGDAADGLSAKAEAKVKAVTGVRIPVAVVPSGTFPRAALKARRVVAGNTN